MNDDENQRLNNKNKMKIINVDTVDQIDRLEMMKKRRRAKKEQLTIVYCQFNQRRDFWC